MAYDLAKDVLRDTLHELSISARDLLDAAVKLEGGAFTRRQLRKVSGWSQKRIHQAVHELVDMEYLEVLTGTNGKTHEYTVTTGEDGEPSPIRSLLHPDELAHILHSPADGELRPGTG